MAKKAENAAGASKAYFNGRDRKNKCSNG